MLFACVACLLSFVDGRWAFALVVVFVDACFVDDL